MTPNALWEESEILHVIRLKNIKLKKFNRINSCFSSLCTTIKEKKIPRQAMLFNGESHQNPWTFADRDVASLPELCVEPEKLKPISGKIL